MLNSGNASAPCEGPSGRIERRFRQIDADASGSVGRFETRDRRVLAERGSEARTTKRSAANRQSLASSPMRFGCLSSHASTQRRKTAKQKHEPRSKLDEEPFERASKQAARHIARGFTHDALSKVLYASSNANAKQEFS
jgi:hypothetical protein